MTNDYLTNVIKNFDKYDNITAKTNIMSFLKQSGQFLEDRGVDDNN